MIIAPCQSLTQLHNVITSCKAATILNYCGSIIYEEVVHVAIGWIPWKHFEPPFFGFVLHILLQSVLTFERYNLFVNVSLFIIILYMYPVILYGTLYYNRTAQNNQIVIVKIFSSKVWQINFCNLSQRLYHIWYITWILYNHNVENKISILDHENLCLPLCKQC